MLIRYFLNQVTVSSKFQNFFLSLKKEKKIKEKADESFLQLYNSRLPVPFSVLGFCSYYRAHFLFLIKTLWLALGQSQKHKINRTVLNYKGFNA